MPNGTPGADQFSAPIGSSTFNGFGGTDTITFDFKLTDATFAWIGNQLIVDTATSHTVLSGFEVFQFKDGTVHNDDGSPLVDDLYYYVNHPDVWSAHVDADAHYNLIGWHENRNPNAFFNTKLYLSIYHDVASSGLSPTQHYDQIGWQQNRLVSLDFDARQYLLSNPDVAAAHVDPLAHFLAFGAAEGRQPFAPLTYPALSGFDYVYYLQHNPDVLAAGVDPLQHFQTFGWKEGRNPNAFFDTAGYLATYTDVAAAGVNPLDHFHQFGWVEGRMSSPLFDPQQYLAHYADVAAAHVDPLLHYLMFGIHEGRSAFAAPIIDIDGTVDAVAEGAANGTHVGLTVAWSGWKSPSLFYTLSGDTSGGGFAIDASTGVITVLDGSKIDFEATPDHAYTVTVTAHDAGQTSTQTFTIKAVDAAPEATGSPQIGVVDELAADGSPVGITFAITDPNGPAATYTLTDDANGRFTIDPNTGEVTVANGAAIDYETTPGHVYTITAKGTVGDLSTSQTFTINVNNVNEVPSGVVFANAVTAIDENTVVGAGIKVADVTVADDTLGSAALSLSGADAGSFELRGGSLYFIGASPDFEAKASYSVTVEADDPSVGGAVDAQATFTLTINDVNEPPTAVAFANAVATIDENAVVGAGIKVADVVVTDDALGSATLSLSGADIGSFELRGMELYFIGASPDFETKSSYAVTVVADDPTVGGAVDASAGFTLSLNDLNDNTPSIGSAAAMAVDENAPAGTLVGTVTASDLDATAPNNTITYTATGGTGLGLFDIDTAAGAVTVKSGAVLDREVAASYTLDVKASDGTLFDTQTLTISLNDLNDNTPSITSTAAMSVDENAAAGTLVGTVIAADLDATAPNKTLTYTATGGSGIGLFEINPTNGKVTVKSSAVLDREAAPDYTLEITVSDGGTPDLFTTQTLTISLNDLNDNTPSISSAAAMSVDENAAAGTLVGTVIAADLDATAPNKTLTYTATGGTGFGLFEINPTNGNVTVKSSAVLDREAAPDYTLEITVSDGGTPDRFTMQTLTISLNDLNDNTPSISSAAAMSVDENAAAGALVGTVIAADLDATAPNKTLTYMATGGTGLALFDIDATSGEVTVKDGAVLDREGTPDYTLEIAVSDGGTPSRSTTQTLTISLNDLNDNTPSISSTDTMSVDENAAAGTLVGTVIAADLDATAPNKTLTYTAAGGTGVSLFEIDPTNGNVTVKSGAVPDREAAPDYTFEVKVSDGGTPGLFTTQTLTISLNDLNDNTPSISSSAAMSVDENATAGTLVGTVIATDLDATAPNKTLTYTATGGTGLALFDIDAASGEVTVKDGALLDREGTPDYTLEIAVSDGGSPGRSTTQTLTISLNDLNDNTPSISSSAAMSVDENAAAGALVGTVIAADLDATAPNKTLTYTATGGTGLALFDIDATSGEVTVKDGALLDREGTPDYTLEIAVSDGGTPGLFTTQTLTISLNDLNDNTPSISSTAAMSVDENAPVGTLVGIVAAGDLDATAPNNAITYTVTGGTGFGLFEVDAATGAVTVKSGAALDRETAASYSLEIKAADGGAPGLFSTQTLTISLNDLNDNTPSISSSAAMAVDENATAGTLVGTVTASDLDATAPNNTITYTATGGTGLGLFEIDAATGAVTVKTGAALDREAAASYTLDVKASDGTLFDTQTLTISLNDLNDNTPSISSAAAMSVDENAAAGTLVGTVIATDLDAAAPNSTITYTATGGTGLGLFEIDAATGAVTVKTGAVPDRESAASYTLEVKAADGGTPGMFSTQTLTISLNDLNDNTPSISSAATMAVDENAPAGTLVGTVVASDLDATAPNSTVTYTATGGTGFGLFEIDAATGAVTVKTGAVLDRETAASYTLDVKASDGTLFAMQTLVIGLNDLNENTPSIVSAAAMAVDENASAGMLVGTVTASDLDATAPNNTIAYTATGGSGLGLFEIDATSGAVTVKTGAVLDRESAASYTLDVKASDGISFTTQTLTISLNDLNDNTPSIGSSAAMSVDENAPAGTLVGTVVASDLDATAPNNTVTYMATGGTGLGLFDIDTTTGKVTVKTGAVLNFDATPSYTLDVKASDGGAPGLFATQTVTISLNDLNEPPVITSGPQTGTVVQGANPVLSGNLIPDSSFELPPYLPGWTMSGNGFGKGVANGGHDGTFAFFAYTGPGNTLNLSRPVSTIAGKTYTLDFWLKNDAGTTNDFAVSWNGQVLNTLHNVAGNGQYTEYTYTVTGAAGPSQLAFTFHDETSTWHLDDVTVQEAANRVVNGGFDVGVGGWTVTAPQSWQVRTNPNTHHSGTGSAEFFAPSSLGGPATLSKTISTTPGMTYTVDFWVLYGASAGAHNFTAKWDGATLLSLVNTPAQDFTHYSYLVTATGASTTLSFTGLADQAAWYLDDVSVTQSTETAAGTITFTDDDTIDTHTVSATANGSGYVGVLRPMLATDSTGGQTGVVNWTFIASDAEIAGAVAPQQSIQQSYTVDIDDHHNHVTPQTVTITLTNPDHAPIITASTDGAVVETFTQPVPTGNLIKNPGFEQYVLVNPSTGQVQPTDWTIGGNVDAVSLIGNQHSGAGAVQFVFTSGSSISQTVSTIAGLTYSLDFWMANSFELIGLNNTVTVTANGTLIDTITNIAGDDTFRQYHVDFVAAGNGTTLTFNVVNPVSYQYIDDVSVKVTGVIPGQESAHGTVTFADADLADTHVVSVTPAGTGYVGTFTAATAVESSSGSNGTVNWDFTVADSALAFLAAQQTVTQTYTLTVDDGRGGHASRDVHVTLTNPEHAPVITGSTDGTVRRDVSLEIPANGITNGDFEQWVNTFPPQLPGWSFGGARAAFIYGPDATHSGGGAVNFFTGTTLTQSVWTVAGVHYTLDFWLQNRDFQSRPNSFTVSWNGTIIDTYTDVPGSFNAPYFKHTYDLVGPGGPVDLTFGGDNPNGWTIDDVSLTPVGIFTPGTETTSGTVTFTDVDLADTHTVSFAPLGLNYLGTFTPTLTPANDSTGGHTGTVNWSFSVSDAALAFLAAQQSVDQTYRLTIDDLHGGHDTRDVTVTLTNPDHAPVVTASTNGSVGRDAAHVTPSGNLILNPSFESGLDPWIYIPGGGILNGKTHTGAWTYIGTGTETVSQSFNTTPGVTYTVDFWLTYGSGNSPHTATVLWDGATVVSLTNVAATDDGFGHITYSHYIYQVVATGSTSNLTFAFDNGGSNFYLDDVSVSSTPNTEATFGTVSFTDVDTIDTHTVSYQAQGTNYVGTFTPTLTPAADTTGGHPGTVNWTFSVPDSALTFLSAQQSTVQTYTVTIADNHGGSTTRDVAVTLTNPDHAPVFTSAPSGASVFANRSFAVPTGNVVQNGGFEDSSRDLDARTTIFPGWAGANFLYLPQGSDVAHSGSDAVGFAAFFNPGTWSQSVPTVADAHYTLSFWAAAAISTDNSIAVNWNGQTVFARVNVPAIPVSNPTGPGDYIQYTVDVVGRAGSSDLTFSLYTKYYWYLDDVSVTAVGVTPGTETTQGSLHFTDVDAADAHTVSVAPNGNIGTLSASIGGPGTVNWSYSVADSALSFLAAQQSVDQVFTVIVDDGHGGSATQNVTVTLTNPDHAPVAHDDIFPSATAAFNTSIDLFVGVNGSPSRAWFNNGQGTFQVQPQSYQGAGGADTVNDVTLADIDKDGNLDVIMALNNQGLAIFRNAGAGVFNLVQTIATSSTPADSTVQAGDLNGDGFADLVTSGMGAVGYNAPNRVLFNNGNGTFTVAQTIGTSSSRSGVALGDFDENGKLDVFVANGVNGNTGPANPSVWLNDGAGHFAAATVGGSDPQSIAGYSVALADFDHDGHLDAFVGRESGGDQVWFGDGHGGFTLHQTVGASSTRSLSVAVGDLNGDGWADVVTASKDDLSPDPVFSTPEIYLNDQHGNLVGAGAILYNMQGTDVALADVNGDGALDVIFDTTSGKAFVFHNDGHAHFTVRSQLATGASAALAAGNLNANIQPQPILANAPRTLAVLANDTDADGDALSVSAVGTSGIGATLSIAPDQRGVVYDASNSAVAKALAAGVTLVDSFSYTVSDGHGGTATANVTLTVTGVNDAPTVANPLADQNGAPNTAFLFQFAANTFDDIDPGDTLTYSATLQDGSALPTWLQFDAATRTFSGTPGPADEPIDVKVTATDSHNASVSDTFTLTLPPHNHAPVLAQPHGPGEVLTKAQSTDIGSLANAMLLDHHFGFGADPNIALDTVIPHVSISATGGGKLDYYKFTVAAGARGIFDIDGGLDTTILLLDGNGNLVTFNDDSLVTDGAGGSPLDSAPNTTYDSFLDYTFAAGGTYYLAVGTYNGGTSNALPVPTGATYQLQVSLSSADLGPAPAPFTIDATGMPAGAVGTLVSSLVDLPGNGGHDNVTDIDPGAVTGIALSAADTSHGAWWYSLDGGANWIPLGAVDEQHALLLAADAGTRLYFQPAAGFAGMVDNAITFHAWDQTSGSANQRVDATVNGGITAISTATVSIAQDHVDLPPTDIAWNGVAPSSGTNLPGSNVTIANLSASDPDDSTGFSYTLLAGSSANFVVTSSGAVSKTNTFASNTTYTLNIQVADADGATFSKTFRIVTGGTGTTADTLTGNASDDTFYGRDGADIVSGGGGNDTLFGQDGNDTLKGGTGNDVINGGAGTDTLDFSDASSGITFTLVQSGSDTTVDLTAVGLGIDTYRNMEGVIGTGLVDTIDGSSGDDVITGGLGDDILRGNDGNDTFKYALGDGADSIDGGIGNDTLTIVGTTGADTLSVVVSGGVITAGLGGSATLTSIESFALDLLAGTDTLSYAGTTEAISANLAATTATGFSSIANVENLTGGDGNDTLAGNSSANVINGGAGDDTISYAIGGGADTIDGGTNGATGDTLAIAGTTGNDTLTVVVSGGVITSISGLTFSNIENFTADLAAGTDTLSYAGTTSAVSATIGGSLPGFASGILGLENLTGGSGDDTLTGDDNANMLSGAAGADSLSGGAGNDILVGDQGDTLLDGGANTDTLQVAASFTSGSDGQIVNVENVTLTAAATLDLSNQSEGFKILGSSGVDTMLGGSGNDILNGQGGNDNLTGNGGADQFRFATNTGTDTVGDFAVGTDKIGLLDTGTTGSGSVNFSVSGSSAGTTLAAADFVTHTSITGGSSPMTTNDDNKVVVITAGVTNVTTATVSGATNDYVVVFNSTAATAQVWFDADWGNTTGRTQVATLTGVTAAQLATLTVSSFVAYNTAADPIVLDLGAPGISLTPIEQGVQFDMDGDGIRDHMAWTAGEDGILAFDFDRSGTIQSGKEIVSPWFAGGNFADSLAALASLDGNHDGRIDAHDADFGRLVVWQDLNHDGVSDPGELYGLVDLGITGIALDATPLDGYADGQALLAQGTFGKADGSTGEFVEVAFDWRAGHHHDSLM